MLFWKGVVLGVKKERLLGLGRHGILIPHLWQLKTAEKTQIPPLLTLYD